MGDKGAIYLQIRLNLRNGSTRKVFSPESVADFQKGHPLTEAELHALREHRLCEIFLANANADAIPAYCLAEVTDADDNTTSENDSDEILTLDSRSIT